MTARETVIVTDGEGLFVITGAGDGGGPKVGVYNFVANANPELTQQKIAEFFAYDSTQRGGVSVYPVWSSSAESATQWRVRCCANGESPRWSALVMPGSIGSRNHGA